MIASAVIRNRHQAADAKGGRHARIAAREQVAPR